MATVVHWNKFEAKRNLRHVGIRNISADPGRLLYVPLQRLMRYPLLINNLIKTVPVGSIDTTQLLLLGQTLEEMNQVVTAVNSFSNESENKLKKVAQVSDLLGFGGGKFREHTGDDLVKPGREWIVGDGEDPMWYEWDTIEQQLHSTPYQLLLFNDILVVCKPSRAPDTVLDYKEHIYLHSLTICMQRPDRLIMKARHVHRGTVLIPGMRVYRSEFVRRKLAHKHVQQWMHILYKATQTAAQKHHQQKRAAGDDHGAMPLPYLFSISTSLESINALIGEWSLQWPEHWPG